MRSTRIPTNTQRRNHHALARKIRLADAEPAPPESRKRAPSRRAGAGQGRLHGLRPHRPAQHRLRRRPGAGSEQGGCDLDGDERILSRSVSERTAAPDRDAVGPVIPPLGVGLPYIASLPAEIYDPALLDFVEITPETLCRERRSARAGTIELVPAELDRARRACAALPIV